MLGSLLGAYYGSDPILISSNFPYFVTQQILGHEKIFSFYDEFLNFVSTNQTNTKLMGEFINIEKKITMIMLQSGNKERGLVEFFTLQ
jgi:hypothetical protein